MKILIIEDEEDIRRIVRLSLSDIGGMDVAEANNGRDGATAAAAESPDGILLDVMMPGLDGPATLKRLRASPETASIPVIFLTAKAQVAELDRLRALGVAGVLTKPFDPITLPDDIRRLVG